MPDTILDKINIPILFVSALGANLSIYFSKLHIPLFLMLIAMIIDWLSGLIKALINNVLSSKIGIKGILKKLLYILIVTVGFIIDYLIAEVFNNFNVDLNLSVSVALMLCIWFTVNEIISILENVAEMGVPIPTFLTKIIGKLKNVSEREE